MADQMGDDPPICLCKLASMAEHIVHIDGVTGSSPVATTKIPGNTAFPGISSCLAEAKITLKAGLSQAFSLLGIDLALAKPELSDMRVFRFILSNSFVGFPLRATDF
ncbi:MAG: hypothetical protein IKE29_20160 [Paenibacillus sp.]|uniref:hypothetical protein n=1 Tax=Paenibacillus sp. TaxID=58172 RepID=UPI0025DDF087|nr:hypothetical protein [Paenibacillus sp.]MBR2566908.1 hypothetical protein [Paenibacillus sp.]